MRTHEEINKILVEAEGGCWHEQKKVEHDSFLGYPLTKEECVCGYPNFKVKSECLTLNMHINRENPDFSKPEFFFRMLKIADKHSIRLSIYPTFVQLWIEPTNKERVIKITDIDQIPALVSARLAEIIKEGKK